MKTRKTRLSRREALSLIAVTTAGGVLMSRAAFAQQAGAGDAGLMPDADVCVIMPESTEGPFYFDPALERVDITEGLPGMPTRVRLQVVDGACRPVPGARVDIWHANAAGAYSGYPNQPGGIDASGETFMRGTQFAGDDGIVEFKTIYPGWYTGRTPHVHFKVFPDDANVLTGQFFFPDEVSAAVYGSAAPYSERGAPDTLNAQDGIARRAGSAAMASITQMENEYLVALIVGVDPAA